MTPNLYNKAAVVVLAFALFTGLFACMCLGRLFMHLRKLERLTYEYLGGGRPSMMGGPPELWHYLWHRKFLDSPHKLIRNWGIRHNLAGRVFCVALVCVALLFAIGHLTTRWSGPLGERLAQPAQRQR